MNSPIPGRISLDDSVALAKLAAGKTVLQIGGYCGKGTVALATTAEHVWLVDDFSGPMYGDREAVMKEIGRNVQENGFNDRVDLVFGSTDDKELAAPLPAFDMAYIDADRDPDLLLTDLAFVRGALKETSTLAFHENGELVVRHIEQGYLAGVI